MSNDEDMISKQQKVFKKNLSMASWLQPTIDSH